MSKINTDNRVPQEVLMEAMEVVEGATHVVILVEKEDCFYVKTNCTHKDLHWLLTQGQHAVMTDLFDID